MAFGTNSNIFQYVAKNLLGVLVQSSTVPTGLSTTGFLADTMKFALYGNTGTPDKTVATAVLCSYNGTSSQWVTADEATGGSGYSAGGNTLGTKGWATDASVGPCFTAAASVWTITGGPFTAYGGLLYDSSITAAGNFAASQGVCFNAFGGAQSVTGGTFTVTFATAGSTANTIFNISV